MFRKCDTCAVAEVAGIAYRKTQSEYNSRHDHCASSITPISISKGAALKADSFLGAVYGSVCDGILAVQHLLPGERRCLSELFFRGDLVDMTRIPQDAEIVALTEVQIRCFCAKTFQSLRRSNDELDASYLAQLREQTKTLADHCMAVAKKTPPERIASFLLEYRRRKPSGDMDCATIEMDLHQKEIGDYLSLEPETVSRSLARLAKDGIISLGPKNKITICEQERLRAIADGGMPRKTRMALVA